MKILHLTLKKKWFDMIASGEKKEEYREIKDYWTKRLDGRDYDVVYFRNGYAKDAPKIKVEIMFKLDRCFGLEVWGAEPRVYYYVIRLGKILSIENHNSPKLQIT